MEVSRIEEYEKALHEYFKKEHPNILKKIAKKKEIDAKLDEAIASALEKFNKEFKGEKD
jgi:F0F1-type ATP synthase alpha subunit